MAVQLTVVVPIFNREHLVTRCLESIAGQTMLPARLVVVDNNSSDGSYRVAKAWAASHPELDTLVLTERKPGASAARNRGLAAVETDYVAFFDSDDVMHPDLVKTVVETFESNPAADIVSWRARVFEVDGKRARPLKVCRKPSLDKQILYSLFSTQTFAVRTDFIRSCGGWQEDCKIYNDWELGVRMMLANAKVKLIPDELVDIYRQQASITFGTEDLGKKAADMSATFLCAQAAISMKYSNIKSRQRNRYLRLLNYRRTLAAAQFARSRARDASLAMRIESRATLAMIRPYRLISNILYNYIRLGGRGAARVAYLLF